MLGVPSAVTVRVGVIVAVAVTVAVDAELVVDVPVAALPPTTICAYTSSPKNCPPAVCMRQLPRSVPVFVGAIMATEISSVALGATADGSVKVTPLICSPPVNTNLNPASHAHVPEFNTFHVFVKFSPGFIAVLSGIDTSLANVIR